MAQDLTADLNLYVTGANRERQCLIQLQLNYSDELRRHEGVMVITNGVLYQKLDRYPAFREVLDNYLDTVEHSGQAFFRKWDRGSNFHQVRSVELNIGGESRRVELVHQARPGDCVIATFLDTWSLSRSGQIPMTIDEARSLAVSLRVTAGEDASDIQAKDSPLSYGDVINLFSVIYGRQPLQEDIITLNGRSRNRNELQLDILNLLDYFDTYKSGLCTTGLGYHSRTIKALNDGRYAIIDPLWGDVVRTVETEELITFIADLCHDRVENDNFFFFIRSAPDGG
jgi:hypothetical protein